MADCVFCKIIKGKLPGHIVGENDKVITFLSLQGHPLVVTKQHIENIYSLDDESACEVIKEAIRIAKAVKKGLNADGVNLVQNNETPAGQDVMHFHLHIKPRWNNDSVRMHFPSEAIEEEKRQTTLEKIKSALE